MIDLNSSAIPNSVDIEQTHENESQNTQQQQLIDFNNPSSRPRINDRIRTLSISRGPE